MCWSSPYREGREIIQLREVTKIYKRGQRCVTAVDRVTMEVSAGEICVLLGPSGCGKTTLLRLINRLTPLTSGQILVNGRDIATLNPIQLRRNIGYVIQQTGLFPHMTVEENVLIVPRLLGWDRERQRRRFMELMQLVGLDPDEYRRRYPRQLSGGQQQRVGVARALAADPPVMLMDEPFGALDPITRDRLQTEFLAIQRQLRKTVIFVSHDLDEAVKLADRIAILNEGRLEQYDSPAEILARPATDFVRNFVGADRAIKRLRLIPADRAITPPPLAFTADDDPTNVRAAMAEKGTVAAVLVNAQGKLLGWLSVERLAAAQDLSRAALPLPCVRRGTANLRDVLNVIFSEQPGWVGVVDGENRLCGVITLSSVEAVIREAAVVQARGGTSEGVE